ESRGHSYAAQSTRNLRGDPRAGFAGVHADDDFGRRRMMAGDVSQSHSERVRGRGIEREFAGPASNSIGAGKSFRHYFFSSSWSATAIFAGFSKRTCGSPTNAFTWKTAPSEAAARSMGSVTAYSILRTRLSGPTRVSVWGETS